jgi:hypothetical protein
MDAGYEKMEEVSLEQLLEGRERPATISGSIPIPIDDVEELDTAAIVEDSSPAVAVMDEPAPSGRRSSAAGGAVDQRLARLEQEIEQLRSEHRSTLEDILTTLNDLSDRIRSKM